MTTFAIDNDNNITAFGSAEEAAAATTIPFDSFNRRGRDAEGGTQGQRWRTEAACGARQGQGDHEGHCRQERA
jgi:hypothetical protein